MKSSQAKDTRWMAVPRARVSEGDELTRVRTHERGREKTHSKIDTKTSANAILQRRQLKYSECPYNVVENRCKKRRCSKEWVYRASLHRMDRINV